MTPNEKIAEALGFERYTYRSQHGSRVDQVPAWKYPKEWEHLRCGTPEHHVPNFVSLLQWATTGPGIHNREYLTEADER